MNDKMFWFARTLYGKPHLAKVKVIKETRKMYYLEKVEDVLGQNYISNRKYKTDTHLFETKEDALRFLVTRLKNSVEGHHLAIVNTELEIREVQDMLEEMC